MRYLLLIITLFLVACSSTLPTVTPYKMEITQGNIVTSKMLAQLKPGMSKSQVKFIVGTPLIQDMFHKDRWDYYLQQIIDGKITEQRRVIIDFKDDKLINVSGDVIPIEKGDIADASASSGYKLTKEDPQVIAKTQTTAATSKVDESSWSDNLMFWKDDKTDADKAALKKQIEAHNQSLNKQAESHVVTENSKSPEIAVPSNSTSPTLTVVESNADPKTMGKAPEQIAKKEERGFWSKLKFWDAAAPVAAAPIVGASSVTPPLATVPVVTVTSAAKPSEPANTVTVTSKPTETKPEIKTAEAPILALPEVVPAATGASVPSPAATVVMAEPFMKPSVEAASATPAETSQTELLRLSESLKTHLDMPLNNPFLTTEPVPLGLRLTSMIAHANEAMIEKANIEINMKADQAAKTTEKAKEVPSFFERMLERVGF